MDIGLLQHMREYRLPAPAHLSLLVFLRIHPAVMLLVKEVASASVKLLFLSVIGLISLQANWLQRSICDCAVH